MNHWNPMPPLRLDRQHRRRGQRAGQQPVPGRPVLEEQHLGRRHGWLPDGSVVMHRGPPARPGGTSSPRPDASPARTPQHQQDDDQPQHPRLISENTASNTVSDTENATAARRNQASPSRVRPARNPSPTPLATHSAPAVRKNTGTGPDSSSVSPVTISSVAAASHSQKAAVTNAGLGSVGSSSGQPSGHRVKNPWPSWRCSRYIPPPMSTEPTMPVTANTMAATGCRETVNRLARV